MAVLEGKAAIVTGSARGIGRAAAELLAEHGARVLISDVDADLAGQVAAEIPGETAVFGGDLTRDGAAEALVKAAGDAFGQIDIVVNNAGYTWDGMAHKMSDEQFRAMLEIHTVVPFKVLRAAAPVPPRRGQGRSGSGPRGVPQGRQRHVDLGNAGKPRPGQLLDREGRSRRADEDPGPRVGTRSRST